MYKVLCFAFSLLVSAAFVFAVQDVASAVEGTIKTIDVHSKTIALKTADGAEQTFHYTDRTTVHGVREAVKGSEDTIDGLKKGSEVAVHYTDKGTVKTAEEIDCIGKDGLKVEEGTVKKIERGTKTLTLETADGAEDTYLLSEHAAQETGMETGEAGKKSEKMTVYYSEEAGQKVVRFFKRVL
jgi:hypothetical protein